MKVTTKSLISYLPFEPAEKLELLETLDTLPTEQKVRVTREIWRAFRDHYRLKVNENFNNEIQKVEEKKRTIGNNFYGDVLKITKEQIDKELLHSSETVDLSAARKSMEQIMREIRASKNAPGPQPNPQKAN